MTNQGDEIGAEGRNARVVVLARGENPSCDYYLLPRLARMDVTVHRLDTRQPLPSAALRAAALVVCRYLPPSWLAPVRRAAKAGTPVCFFLDDDYGALMRDGALPLGYRALVAVQGLLALRLLAPHLHRLWVSTPELQRRHAGLGARLLEPLPGLQDLVPQQEAADAEVPRGAPTLRFHAQLSHLGDHAFAADIVRAVLARSPDLDVEVIGPASARALWGFSRQVRFLAEMPWPVYRAQTAGSGGILMVPLLDTALNRGRSPTKAIDAARMGAAGLFAQGPAYAALAGIAPLLPASVDAWCEAILNIVGDPAARISAARALVGAVAGWRERGEGLDL